MSAGGVKWSTPPKIASVGHDVGGGRRAARRSCGPAPVFGHADHPVERDGAVEPVAGRGLERVHPAHAEAHHRDLGRRRRAPRRSRPRLRGRRAAASSSSCGRRRPSAPAGRRSARTSAGARVNGSGQHTANPCVARRRHRSSNSGRMPMMSGWSAMPAERHALRAGVDRLDRDAVDAPQRDALDLDVVCGPRASSAIRCTARGCSTRRGGPGLP